MDLLKIYQLFFTLFPVVFFFYLFNKSYSKENLYFKKINRNYFFLFIGLFLFFLLVKKLAGDSKFSILPLLNGF